MKVIKWLDKHFEGTLLSISLVMMTVILVAQIIMRYFFKSSLTWAEELSCILLVWSGFLSISYTLRTNTAMRLTMLLSYLPRLGRNAVLLAAQIIMLVFFLVPFILTQVMSNLATLTIFIPLVTSACIRMGVDPRAAVVGVITASCVSIMTPMAAPCQIMIIEPGGYTLKDYLKCGTPLALILIVVSVFFLPTLYPFA